MSWSRQRRGLIVLLFFGVAVLCAAAGLAPAGRVRILDRNGVVLDPQGDVAPHLVHAIARKNPTRDVTLTIDAELQRFAQDAVAGHEAAAVAVVEVETGRILALVSSPGSSSVDRTLGQTYPPASTFKLVTAVAGLEAGMAHADERITCTGERVVGTRVLRDMEVHGTIDFLEALQHSCNVYFWTIGDRVGIDRLAAVARDFGFGEPTGLDIDGDAAGTIPDGSRYGSSQKDRVQRTNAAIGSGDVKVTVVQLAMAYAALANGGRLYAPQVVRGAPVLRRKLKASPATLSLVRKGMYRAVNSRGGTAIAAKRGAVKMLGKTGTSKSRDPGVVEPHAWFAGFAPADHPTIAIVVMVEHGGIGGAVAAPIARTIIDSYFTRVKR